MLDSRVIQSLEEVFKIFLFENISVVEGMEEIKLTRGIWWLDFDVHDVGCS